MTNSKLDRLQVDLRDNRSRRVVFVPHCILNENVRYLGGAARPGGVTELMKQYGDGGIGVYQMPCPEQRAWGGILKRYLVPMYGSRGTVRYWLRRPLTWVFLVYTRFVYAQLAHRVVSDVADYVRSGFEVVEIVGIGASPSCGVFKSLDLSRSLCIVADYRAGAIDAVSFNSSLMGSAVTEGSGYFVKAIRRGLRRRHLPIPFTEHDLVAELREHRLLQGPHSKRAAGIG